jgi:hypothetical protein
MLIVKLAFKNYVKERIHNTFDTYGKNGTQ